MPTFHDPVADGDEARESLRALAHATRAFDDPAQTYELIGDLIVGVRSIRQVLDQLADAHLTHQDWAHADAGDSVTGAAYTRHAANALRDAAAHLGYAEAHLDLASQHSGRIIWQPPLSPTDPDRAVINDRLAARFGTADPFAPASPESPWRGLSL